MSVVLDIRNPDDLVVSFDQIEIQRGVLADGSDMANLITNLAINVATASDISKGYTSYLDTTGTIGTHYYRFRYKNSITAAVSNWSEIYLAGLTVLHNLFRRKMRDTNSAKYFFTNDDINSFIKTAVRKLFPHTYMEGVDDSLTSSGTNEIYSFPTGVFRIDDIQLLNISGSGEVYSRPKGWNMRGRQLIFNHPLANGYPMRLYVAKKFTKLAEVPEEFDDLIMDLMRLEAYETLEAHRSNYYKYTTVVNPEGGNLPSIRTIVERLQATTRDRLNSLRRVRRPAEYSM